MTKSWDDRTQYGVIIKKLIQSQVKKYGTTKDAHLKIKFVTSISNLISTQNTMINDYEGRVDLKQIEEIVKENARLKSEISVRNQRKFHNRIDEKHQKEIDKFQRLSSTAQMEYQKNCEIEHREKDQGRYSEVLT